MFSKYLFWNINYGNLYSSSFYVISKYVNLKLLVNLILTTIKYLPLFENLKLKSYRIQRCILLHLF